MTRILKFPNQITNEQKDTAAKKAPKSTAAVQRAKRLEAKIWIK